MDILHIIRRDLDVLPNGPHSIGLASVLRHIEVAFEHLARGQEQQADSAFTDTIYRTNQAFEGSIKEAYRVLAGKDPQHKTTFEIEQYLQKNEVFRDRVLAQFTAYRTEWRNPSTHNYNLDFDEDEAFLAIMSVSAFSKLLIDQIAQKLRFSAVADVLEQIELEPVTSGTVSRSQSLSNDIADSIVKFMTDYIRLPISYFNTEMELLGALSAYLERTHPDYDVKAGIILDENTSMRADMVVANGSERVVIELKRSASYSMIMSGLRRLVNFVKLSNVTGSLLFTYGGNDVVYGSSNKVIADVSVTIVAPLAFLSADEMKKSR